MIVCAHLGHAIDGIAELPEKAKKSRTVPDPVDQPRRVTLFGVQQ